MSRTDHACHDRGRGHGLVNAAVHSTGSLGFMQAMHSDYANKPDGYYAHARTDIAPFLPPHADRVLEIGCGDGATLAWLKAQGRCALAVGIESFPGAAEAARGRADHVEPGNAEQMLEQVAPWGRFDLVLCLDVLEHMVDPWQLLRRLEPLTTDNAVLILSVPNVRHYKVSLALLLFGQWQYQQAGVLDRTHLRFFTRASAQALATGANLRLRSCVGSRPPAGSPSWLADLLSLGLLRDLFSVQYLVAASKR
jgi:2-polyprenyl-3-methyl-5-hydroxy-6-metoxy-1,4-benzoquinol methylase